MKTVPHEPLILGNELLPQHILGPVKEVFARAREMGAPPVRNIVVESEASAWKQILLGLALNHRRRTVLVFRSMEALELAGRLSIGGALPFPPSSIRALRASEAASTDHRETSGMDPARLAEILDSGWTSLHLEPAAAWRKILGTRGMMELLVELASVLKLPVVIDDGGNLLLPPEMTGESLREAFLGLSTLPRWADPEMLRTGQEQGMENSVRISAALGRLPEGDFPGSWNLSLSDNTTRWTLRGLSGEVSETSGPGAGKSTGILRLPSWLHLDLARPGSPGRELLELWNRKASTGLLWIPNLRPDGLEAVLALRRSVLVDGPVLPPGD